MTQVDTKKEAIGLERTSLDTLKPRGQKVRSSEGTNKNIEAPQRRLTNNRGQRMESSLKI